MNVCVCLYVGVCVVVCVGVGVSSCVCACADEVFKVSALSPLRPRRALLRLPCRAMLLPLGLPCCAHLLWQAAFMYYRSTSITKCSLTCLRACAWLYVRRRGYGVRATEYARRGSFMLEYAGEIIDEAELAKRMEAARMAGAFAPVCTLSAAPCVCICARACACL